MMNYNKSRALIDAEQEFLADLLSSIGDKPDELIIDRYGKAAEQYFVDDGHKLIYSTMLELAGQNKTIDCVSIAQSLLNRKLLGTACSIEQITAVLNKSEYSLSRRARITDADEKLSIMHADWEKRQMRHFSDIVSLGDEGRISVH